MLSKIFKFIFNKKYRFIILSKFGFYNKLSDINYLKKRFKISVGYDLNLENPKSYNEKLQWIKLYDHNPIYPTLVDKYEVKKYVSNVIGEKYVIPTLGIFNSFNEIDFEKLPTKFVIKCTHDSGGIIICKNKNKLNIKKARRKIEKSLKHNFFYNSREWPYKNIKPRIIIEKYIEEKNKNKDIDDYKFFVFNGEAKFMFIATDRYLSTDTCFDFYDMNFNHLPFTNGHPNSTKKIIKPKNFDQMKQLSEKLAKDLTQARIDFYSVDGQIYFGEITFFHWGGMVPFDPIEWDYKIGDWLKLPKKELDDNYEKCVQEK